MKPDLPEQIDLAPLFLRADIPSSSINVEQRTFDVTFSTGALGLQKINGLSFMESLSLEPAAVRLSRLNSGAAPFLKAHRGDDLDNVIGVVVPGSARITKGVGIATIRLSRREAVEPIWRDIQDGIIRNISTGYRVHKYVRLDDDGDLPTLRGVDWEPFEISAVPMPVDVGAKVRSEDPLETNPCVIVTRSAEETAMADEPIVTLGSTLLTPPVPVVVPAAEPEEPAQRSDRVIGAEEERERIQGILEGCQAARLTMSTAQKLIKDGTSLLEARGIILRTMGTPGVLTPVSDKGGQVERDNGGRIRPGVDALDNVWRGIQNALLAKIAPEYFKLEEIGYPYQSRSALAFAELCLHHRGFSTTSMTKNELASAALGYGTRGSGFHTTSDFANILIDAIGKVLRTAYSQLPQSFEAITQRMSLSDFKTMNLVQFGEAPALVEVKEHGEFTRGTIADAKETIRLKTYGRVFSITRQALINDDLNAFGQVPAAFARSARQKESDLVWEQITSNPTMGDGIALFHASHGNLDSSGNAIDDTVIGEGFAAMRVQKGLDGATFLNIVPRYLIVPVAKESLALKYTSVITPATGATVNPYASRLTVITEPRLDANSTTAWYLASGSESGVPIIALAFLDGQDGPMVETKTGFEIDGIEIKCRHDVAAKVVDYRGLFKNVGA